MPRIYVPNKGGGHDFSAAEKFGQLHFLSEGPMSKYATSKIFRHFAMQLRESSPEDYILQTSLTTMNVIAAACFVELHHRLNLLLYREGEGGGIYIGRRIFLTELLTGSGGTAKEIDEMIRHSEGQ